MKISTLSVAVVGFLMASINAGCDVRSQQDDFARDASGPPSGYTNTDYDGKTLSDDKDDWRPSPVYYGIVNVDAAYPNPAQVTDYIRIRVSVMSSGEVRGGLVLRTFPQGGQAKTLGTILGAQESGVYDFYFPASAMPSKGLHRLVVLDMGSEVVSYGDVMIE